MRCMRVGTCEVVASFSQGGLREHGTSNLFRLLFFDRFCDIYSVGYSGLAYVDDKCLCSRKEAEDCAWDADNFSPFVDVGV